MHNSLFTQLLSTNPTSLNKVLYLASPMFICVSESAMSVVTKIVSNTCLHSRVCVCVCACLLTDLPVVTGHNDNYLVVCINYKSWGSAHYVFQNQ